MDGDNHDVKKRCGRTTKKQIEIIMDYLEENKILLCGKIDGKDINKMELMWSNLAELLNSSGKGPVKSAQQWKKVVHELKNNIKKRAREVHIENVGTGGGPKKIKTLTDIEERMLQLVSKVTIEGAPITEPGLDLPENLESAVILLAEEVPEDMQEVINFNNLDATNETNECEMITETPRKKAGIRTAKKMNRRRPRYSEKHQSAANISNLSLNVGLQTHAFKELAIAIKSLSDSVNKMAEALNKIAEKLE